MTFSADKPWNELPDLPPDLAFIRSAETVQNTMEEEYHNGRISAASGVECWSDA